MENFKFKVPEKTSTGKKIRKIAGVLGLSLASYLGGDKLLNDKFEENKDLTSGKENTEQLSELTKQKDFEYQRNELEEDKEKMEDIAYQTAKEKFISEESFKSFVDMIVFEEENIKLLEEEIERRKKGGKPTEQYKNQSNEELDDSLIFLRSILDDDKAELKEKMLFLKNQDRSKFPSEKIQETYEKIKKTILSYDIGREWIVDNMQNPKYRERLKKEYKASYSYSSREDLDMYIDNIVFRRTQLAEDSNFVLSKDITKSFSEKEEESINISAFLKNINNKVYFKIDEDTLSAVETSIHEYAHKATEAELSMLPATINLLLSAFDSTSTISNLSETGTDLKKMIEYYSSPTEMYARKKVFDFDLEKFGIKKYEEEFTNKHYLKARKLLEEGKLKMGSQQFMYIIKPKMMKKVMNEIASLDTDSTNFKKV